MTHLKVDAVSQQTAVGTERETVAEILPPLRAVRIERPVASIDRRFNRPIGTAIAVSIVALTVSWVSARTIYGDRWLEPFRQALQPDTSIVTGPARDNLQGLRPGEIELVLTDDEGRTVRVAAQRAAVTSFESELLFFLKRKEETATQQFRHDIRTAFDAAFADSGPTLEAYADWFFEWQRSWILMKEALLAGSAEILNVMSPAKIWEAVTARTQGYLMENYQARVLKPNERNPKIQRGLEQAFQAAHGRYRTIVAELDTRERNFIKTHTRLLEAYPADSVIVKLDWPAQRWKIPAHYAEDRAERVYRSAAIMGASVAAGPLLVPILNRVGATVMQRLAGRVVLSRSGQIVGGVFAAETIGVSLLLGAAFDYAANRLDEKLSRDGFIREHRKALDETRNGWEALAAEQLGPIVAGWYRDTRQALVISRDPPTTNGAAMRPPATARTQ